MGAKTQIKAVDFFCGGGGMSYGIRKSGIKVLAGIDNDDNCRATYEANIKDSQFIQADVFELTEKKLEKELNIKPNDNNLVLIGCSPCQYWSIINTDRNKSQKSKNLLIEFERFVKYFMPGYVIVENVPGILRNKEESGLQNFIDWLNTYKYNVHFEIHNTNDYGVPQNRKRFTLIASRVGNDKVKPIKSNKKKPHVIDVLGEKNGFPKIKAGHKDQTPFKHSVAGLNALNLRRLKKVKKNGGNRFDFADDKELQLKCFINKNDSFKDTFGRLWWNRPASTITTRFTSISNGRFVHPEENRGLSLREGAVLQTFPKDYIFEGASMAVIAKIIGNAVPPEYAKRIGLAILKNHNHAI